jgi:hypothetical protein
MVDVSKLNIFMADNHLLAIQRRTHTRPKRIQGTPNAEQCLSTIWHLRNGPRRGDISTRYHT